MLKRVPVGGNRARKCHDISASVSRRAGVPGKAGAKTPCWKELRHYIDMVIQNEKFNEIVDKIY